MSDWKREAVASATVEDRLGGRGRLALTALAVVLYAGFFKGSPLLASFPIDLTVLGVALTLLGLFSAGLVDPSRIRPALPVIGLWLIFLLGVGRYAADSYATIKVERLYGITLIAAVGAVVLLKSERRQRAWVLVQIGLGVLLSVSAVLAPAPTFLSGDNALALEGSNTIAAGRAAGVAVVGCLVLALLGTQRRALLTLLGLGLVYPLLNSGSRGPVAAAILAVILVALLAPSVALRRFTRLSLIAASILIGYYTVRSDTVGGVGRVTSTLFAGNFSDTSSEARATLWRDAVTFIVRHPFGSGWGGLSNPRDGFHLLGHLGLNYPHDVLLEITAEAGWVAGAAAVAFLWLGLRRLRRAASDPYQAALFGIAIFFVLNALVSGDVNDNRLMWASVAIAWASTKVKQREEEPAPVVPAPVVPRRELVKASVGDPAWADALGLTLTEDPTYAPIVDDQPEYVPSRFEARWDAMTPPKVRIIASILFVAAFIVAAQFPPHLTPR